MENECIVNAAKKFGLEKIGFCSAKNFSDEYKSVIAAAFPYYIGEVEDANISKYCFGLDYHKVIFKIFDNLCNELNINDYKTFCDTSKNNDRLISYNCGLGFFGKNSMLINDEFGSYFFIGYIFCNEDVVYSDIDKRECNKCGLCEKSCPGQAIFNGKVDVCKCLSNITQKKGELDDYEKNLIVNNNTIFGCDICQNVCPHNKKIKKTNLVEFSKNLITKLSDDDLMGLSNKDFIKKYGDRAFSWRGKQVLLRNLSYINNKFNK